MIGADEKITWRKADRILGCDARGQVFIHGKDRTVAAMLSGDQEADARRIVQCVNAHDELVEALRYLLREVRKVDSLLLPDGFDYRAVHNAESAVSQDATNPTHLSATLAGRCANGYERDQGRRVHAVPYSDTLARNGYAIHKAACGAAPGPRSGGWSLRTDLQPTCPRCVKRLAKA